MDGMERSERLRPSPPLPAPGWTDAWALFLDVDGSLLDFAQHPGEVETPEGLQRDIAALHAALDGAVALVSGRAIDAIDDVLDALHHIPAAGLHGLERREAGGAYFAPPPAPDALNAVHAEAQHVAVAFPGAVAERKGPNLALHWRAAPLAQDPFRAFAAAALRLLPGYRVQFGDQVLELRPGGESADKGTAVETFLQQRRSAGVARCSSATTSPTNTPSPSSTRAMASASSSAIATTARRIGNCPIPRPCARGCGSRDLIYRSARMTRQASLDLGVIGNGTFGALIDAEGRVVWCCLPAFDGDPAFCALLSPKRPGGAWAIELEDFAHAEQRYIPTPPSCARSCTTARRRGGDHRLRAALAPLQPLYRPVGCSAACVRSPGAAHPRAPAAARRLGRARARTHLGQQPHALAAAGPRAAADHRRCRCACCATNCRSCSIASCTSCSVPMKR
jgi:trehalose 6-phosphate phosphatase